jgi:tetratricopeptide (TPR) repeat protein
MNQDRTEGAGMIEVLAWLEVNKKRLAIGALVLLVVGFGIYLYTYMADEKEIDASAALIALHPPLSRSETNEPPVPPSAFLKVVNEHAGTAAAERALLLAGSAYFTEGNYAEAQKQFDRLIAEHPASKWAADAAYGIAASIESQGKQDEAITAYKRVLTSYANSPVASEAHMALARIYETKNQPAEALKEYDELTKASAMSMRSQEAMMARNQLLKKHPELDKPVTNVAPTIAPVTLPVATNKSAATATPKAAPMTNKPTSATTAPAAAQKK